LCISVPNFTTGSPTKIDPHKYMYSARLSYYKVTGGRDLMVVRFTTTVTM